MSDTSAPQQQQVNLDEAIRLTEEALATSKKNYDFVNARIPRNNNGDVVFGRTYFVENYRKDAGALSALEGDIKAQQDQLDKYLKMKSDAEAAQKEQAAAPTPTPAAAPSNPGGRIADNESPEVVAAREAQTLANPRKARIRGRRSLISQPLGGAGDVLG